MIKPTRDQFRSPSNSRGTSILKAGEYTFLAILLVIGTFVRLFFLSAQSMPRFDPWWHLLLVENLRAGRGFTLFVGQPYIWCPPFWHGLAALMPRALGLDQLAALFSLLSIPLTYVFARVGAKMSVGGAGVAGLFMAASGPLVAFTCHYGRYGVTSRWASDYGIHFIVLEPK